MPGPPAKPAATRQRKNRTTTAATIEALPARAVELPERDPDWHPMARMTWAVWWASPLVDEWVDADVPGLLELAVLVDDFWNAKNVADRAKARSEVRLSSREYGLSPLSRRQLQWEIKRLERPTAPPVPTPRRAKDPRLQLVTG